jgi:hypothetical protein
MPVLGEDDVLEQRRNAMDRVDYGIAIGNGERTAGAEVVLHVDNDQNVMLVDPHRVSCALKLHRHNHSLKFESSESARSDAR